MSLSQSRQNGGYMSVDDDSDITTDEDTESLFDESADETDIETDITTDDDTDSLSRDSDDDIDDEESLFDDEERHPPEYYLNGGANLDIKRLRQKRYRNRTQSRLDWVKEHCIRYCTFVRKDLVECFQKVDAQFLHGFLSWVCDQRRGKKGRRRPGIRRISSLHTFWKWYLLVYKQHVGEKIDEIVQVQGLDVVMIVAKEKKLSNKKRESATMYVQDLTEFALVLLATTLMSFEIGWLRIQIILFCQLAAITGNRPEALIHLRYQHLRLNLVRDPCGNRPRLFIELTAEYTKTYLGMKDANVFQIPEIIYDPTLILSPHVFLLGMLFKAQAFDSPSIDSPEKLYSLNVLNGLGEQKLPLKEELDDEFIFCQAFREADGVRIARHVQATTDWIRYRMKRAGEITGMAQVTKPYCLRDGNAKAMNESPDVSDSLQCLVLQHASIETFLKHYLDRNITADLGAIYRGMEPQKELMRFACSMSRSIDPRRPWRLTKEQSASVNDLPCIVKLAQRVKKLSRAPRASNSTRRVKKLSGAPRGSRREEKRKKEAHRRTKTGRVEKLSGDGEESREEIYGRAVRRLANEKQRQRRLLLVDIRDRYKKEQPVIDSERQLSGKVVDEEVRSVLKRSENMTTEHLLLIDAVMTLPEKTPEKELQRRIVAINAVEVYCGVEEGRSYRDPRPGRSARSGDSAIAKAENQTPSKSDVMLSRAILSVRTDERPKVCFLCLGNSNLPMDQRVKEYATVGSLSRHFLRCHIKKLQMGKQIDCRICDVKMVHRIGLLHHAETIHGTVTRICT